MAQKSDQRLHRLVAEHSADVNVLATGNGTLRFVSASSSDLFGWRPADLLGMNQDDFCHPDDLWLVQEARDSAFAADPAITTIYRFRCRDGGYRWTEAVSRRVETEGEWLLLSTVRDIAERKTSELDLQRQASTDPLTGVANRTVFMDRLEHALNRLERTGLLVAVLFLDLDRFKVINDSLGHSMGDSALLQMAERLVKILRPSDTLARLGGDEFAVVVEDLAVEADAVALGERIINSQRAPFEVNGEKFVCTVSVGIAVTAEPQHSAHRLLQEADLALYRAKDRGRDRAEMFDEHLRTTAVERLGTERMLRSAMDEDRLLVAYQPIIDLTTGRTVAAEALVRVVDRQRLVIEARDFIDVAEDAGLVGSIDEWVLRQTIRQAARWQKSFAGIEFSDVSINASARHIADDGFAEGMIEYLAAAGVPPTSLQVEVTESVLMEASNSAMTGLNTLRRAGVKVGLDDFGTGYSSLSYLRQFPIDFVKIDQSFVHVLDEGRAERAIVASIIDLSHALDVCAVAEGVESESQLDELRSLGCDRAQGFLLGRPGPPEAVERLVLAEVGRIAGAAELNRRGGDSQLGDANGDHGQPDHAGLVGHLLVEMAETGDGAHRTGTA